MNKNILKDKSFSFALRCVNLYKHMCSPHKEYVLSKQLQTVCYGRMKNV